MAMTAQSIATCIMMRFTRCLGMCSVNSNGHGTHTHPGLRPGCSSLHAAVPWTGGCRCAQALQMLPVNGISNIFFV